MSISAMKQALEALEKVVKWHSVRDKNDLPLKPINQPPEIKESIDASAALRQAIADAEKPDLARVGEVGVWGDKREWVGLTDDEIYDYADKFLYQHGSNYGIKSFGKAIEAKLKEKNT